MTPARVPLIWEWNTAVEHAWARNDVLSVGYAGSAGRQLLRREVGPGSSSVVQIAIATNHGSSDYNALQVLYLKQTGHLTYNLNYTFSKALGILGSAANFNFTAAIDPFNLQSNYGPQPFDRSQIFNASYAYQFGRVVENRLIGGLTNGWLVSGITTVESGGNLRR